MTREDFLALLYVDADVRARFLEDSSGEARRAGLSASDAVAVAAIDRDGLQVAAESFARKRARARRPRLWRRLLRALRFS